MLNDDEGQPVPEAATADFINDYFATIGPKLAANFPVSPLTTLHKPALENINTFKIITVSEQAVLKEVKKVNM